MSKPIHNEPGLSAIVQQGILMPKESLMEMKVRNQNLFIGIPRETSFQENRIALVPESVALLVNNGHQVLVESNAGKNANFTDTDYSEAGAQIAFTTEDVYKNAKLILKVAPPSENELELMQEKQTLLSILQIAMQKRDFVSRLKNKRITALAYEYKIGRAHV